MKNNSNILTIVVGITHHNSGAIEASVKFPKKQEHKMVVITQQLYGKVLKDAINWKQSIYMSIKNDLIAESLFESKGVTPSLYYIRKFMGCWK